MIISGDEVRIRKEFRSSSFRKANSPVVIQIMSYKSRNLLPLFYKDR